MVKAADVIKLLDDVRAARGCGCCVKNYDEQRRADRALDELLGV